jgi:hypothetical protein
MSSSLISFDMRTVFVACNSVTTFPAATFVVFEYAWKDRQTNRVCVFHRGIILLAGVYFCLQMAITFFVLARRRGPASGALAILVTLLHTWVFVWMSQHNCSVWPEPPLLLLTVAVMRCAAVLAFTRSNSKDSLIRALVAGHGALETLILLLGWIDASDAAGRVAYASLSSLLFSFESSMLLPKIEFCVLPDFDPRLYVAVSAPRDTIKQRAGS